MPKEEPIYRLPPDIRDPSWAQEVSTAYAESLAWPWGDLGIPDLWLQTEGEGVVCAVLDTGLGKHRELDGQVLDARDFTGSPYGVRDVQGHSTWCASAIAAVRGNNFGGAGIAPKSKLIIGKVLSDSGSGTDRAIVAGLRWAYESGAIFCSNSYGGPTLSPSILGCLQELNDDARAKGRHWFPFFASGNDGGSVNWPGASSLVCCVGSANRAGKISDFSSRGPELDIIGPGEKILGCAPDNRFIEATGSSMATPICCAVGMLAYSKHQQMGGVTDLTNIDEMVDHLRRAARNSDEWAFIDPRKMAEEWAQHNEPPAVGWWNRIRFNKKTVEGEIIRLGIV